MPTPASTIHRCRSSGSNPQRPNWGDLFEAALEESARIYSQARTVVDRVRLRHRFGPPIPLRDPRLANLDDWYQPLVVRLGGQDGDKVMDLDAGAGVDREFLAA